MTARPWKSMTALLAWAGASLLDSANAVDLTVGDPAPKLAVAKWVQGEPIEAFARDKIYVVEFWATWCGPCIAAIPHLNELHLKYRDKGVVFIGQNILEADAKAVPSFIEKMENKMAYRVALDAVPDDSKGTMFETWMRAADQRGIPTTFVVNKEGAIAWIGHPTALKEELLERIHDGNYDLRKAAAEYAEKHRLEPQLRALWQEFMGHRVNNEWDEAETTLKRVEDLLPQHERDDVHIERFKLLLEKQSYPEAYRVAEELSDALPEAAMLQNDLAWTIAIKEGIERNLVLAEKIARRAYRSAEENSQKAEILDTLARVLFLKGEQKGAVEWQQKALEFAEGNRRTKFQETLDKYRAGKLPDVY